jgi:hypothetical protein
MQTPYFTALTYESSWHPKKLKISLFSTTYLFIFPSEVAAKDKFTTYHLAAKNPPACMTG